MAIWGGLTIAVKREKQKVKEKRKDKHLNAEFHRIARRNKKAFLSDQCREVKNTMEKMRSLQEN